MHLRTPRAFCGVIGGALLLAACGGASGEPTSSTSQAGLSESKFSKFPARPSPQQLRARTESVGSNTCNITTPQECYTPQQFQQAYGVSALLSSRFDGKGETIVVVEGIASPTVEADLKSFDAAYGLADPPSIKVVAPFGTPSYSPTSSMALWAAECSVDVQWAHAMAPGADIVVLSAGAIGTQEGPGAIVALAAAVDYAVKHDLGNVLSLSWGVSEPTLFNAQGYSIINAMEGAFENARTHNITVLAAAGDQGSAGYEATASGGIGPFYPYPVATYPGSSPNVTAVGGTTLLLNPTTGARESEVVWNTSSGAGGGGVSQYFAEPSWQTGLPHSDQKILCSTDGDCHRGVPDVSLCGAELFAAYFSFGNPWGWSGLVGGFSGTSLSTPMWGGIVADLNQLVEFPLGFLNPNLYESGGNFLNDITVGNNAWAPSGVSGYNASKGWDPASGWGTANLAGITARSAAADF
jgi:subtilase family serine protease